MGLDIYLSKKTFIGAMFRTSKFGGIISLTRRGKPIPIKPERVTYVEEDVYHGKGMYWLQDWLNRELPEAPGNAEEREIDDDLVDRLHQACVEVLAHRNKPDFREVCKEKLRCILKPDIDKEALEQFLHEVEALAKATSQEEKTDDAVFAVSFSW